MSAPTLTARAINRIEKFGIAPVSPNTTPSTTGATMSVFDTVPEMPPDAIFGVKAQYSADANPKKVNLTVGAYRTAEGKPLVLKVVRKAQYDIAADDSLVKEYLPITGDKEYIGLATQLLFGEGNSLQKAGRVAAVQALSGTGSLRVIFEFLAKNFPGACVYVSDPTWGNHRQVIDKAGLKRSSYRYYNAKTFGLDFESYLEDIKNAPDGSVFLIHSCAHNPTGVDPTQEQWKQLAEVYKAKKHIAFFDSAYQGYATGSLDGDAFGIRQFAASGVDIVFAVSFAKNMGLYGERVGLAGVVTSGPQATKACTTQLAKIIRPMYSNPPRHGAEIVKRVLRDPELFQAWKVELKGMSDRILAMRTVLRKNLEALGAPSNSGNWNHVTDQIGMFCYTGLTKEQVLYARKKYAVYLLGSGRISVAGVNPGNVEYIAQAFNDALRNA